MAEHRVLTKLLNSSFIQIRKGDICRFLSVGKRFLASSSVCGKGKCHSSQTFQMNSALLCDNKTSLTGLCSSSLNSFHFKQSFPLNRQLYTNANMNLNEKTTVAFQTKCEINNIYRFSHFQNIVSSKMIKVAQCCKRQAVSNYSTKTTSSSMFRNQSALHVKRVVRKKLPKIHNEGMTRQLNNVVAYAVGEEINLKSFKDVLVKQGLYFIGDLPTDATNTMHVRGKYNLDQKPKEIFVFDDGSIVFWCVPEVERGAFLKLLRKYCEAPYSMPLVLSEREELDFAYVKDPTSVINDFIKLQVQEKTEEESDKGILELYALSNALAQSVKLSMWEASLETFIGSIEAVTEDVRHGNKISMTRRQVLKKSGELMALRHLINLSSDLLDTPDFYWDRADLEPLYQSLNTQLNVSRRTKVINEKLTHCNELVELVSHHLSDEHHIRLEVMIIILIFVEVAIEILNIVKHYFESNPTKASSREEDAVSAKPRD